MQPVAPPLKPSKKSAIAMTILFAVLLVGTQFGIGLLAIRASSLYPWMIGTPIAYFVIAGLHAFITTRNAEGASERRGCLSGLAMGGTSALIATLIVALVGVLFVVNIRTQPAQPSRLPGPGLAVFAYIFIFIPFFLLVNLGGLLLAMFGGMPGSLLKKQRIITKQKEMERNSAIELTATSRPRF